MRKLYRGWPTLLVLCLCIAKSSASEHAAVVKVATAEQLVQAMLDASASRRATVIEVAPGHYALGQTFSSEVGSSVLPPVGTPISIIGQRGATTTFDASRAGTGQAGRVFTVLEHGYLTVKNITITGGLASCQDDCANNGGGAAENHGGILAFRRCTLMGNEASSLFFDAFGDPSQNAFGLGGAILNASGSLFLQDTTVNGNSTMGAGGGIAVTGGTALIRHSVISANTARSGPQIWSSVGAGIYVANAELSIEESSIEENVNGPDEDNNSRQFGDGGGVYVDGNSEVWIEDSAVTQNQNVPLGNGGGLFNTGTIHLLNSTVGENTTSTIGGGIFNRGTVKLRGVTVAHNTAFGIIGAHDPCEDDRTCPTGGDGIFNDPVGTVRVADTVVAQNGSDCTGVLMSLGHNALGSSGGCTLQPVGRHTFGDLLDIDVRLGTFVNDGTAGQAHYPLLADSPLIDAGGKVARDCTRLDQIGNPRVDGDQDHDRGSICDIGAIEFQRVGHQKPRTNNDTDDEGDFPRHGEPLRKLEQFLDAPQQR